MDIHDAITRCKDIADDNRKLFEMCPHTPDNENGICLGLSDCKFLTKGKNNGCLKCAMEYEELANWLEELIKLRKFIEDNKLLYEVNIENVVSTVSPLANVSCITWYNILLRLQRAGYIICEKK